MTQIPVIREMKSQFHGTTDASIMVGTVLKTEVAVIIAYVLFMFVCLFVQLRTEALRLIVRSWLDVPTFATRLLHACHHARASSGGRWNCGREMSGNFAEMMTSTPFRDLLHAVKLRHGTDRLCFPSEGRCAEDIFALKI
jgi:hypothetical protein